MVIETWAPMKQRESWFRIKSKWIENIYFTQRTFKQ